MDAVEIPMRKVRALVFIKTSGPRYDQDGNFLKDAPPLTGYDSGDEFMCTEVEAKAYVDAGQAVYADEGR